MLGDNVAACPVRAGLSLYPGAAMEERENERI